MGLIKQYSRISHHTLSQANISTGDVAPFTVPLSEDFTDGTWTARDLALSEIGVVEDEKRVYIRINNEIREFLTGPVGGIVPGNSTDVIINLGGEFYADGGFQYDPTGSRQLNIFTDNSIMQMGQVDAGLFTFPGAGFTYDGAGEVYFQDGYIDPGYAVGGADQKSSSFFAGNLTSVGGLDYAWQAGYRDLATQEQSIIGGQPGQANIIVKDPSNLGIRVQVTDLMHVTTIDKTAAQYTVSHPENLIELGQVTYGGVQIPRGAGISYSGGNAQETSGFFAGDLSTLGGINLSWVAGYRDTSTGAAYNIAGEPGEVTLVARDAAGDGIEANITNLEWDIRLEKPGAVFKVTSANTGTGTAIEANDAGVVTISNSYELPDNSGTAGYQVITDGTNWVYSNQPRYVNYFEFGVGTVTNIGTTNVWQKLNAVTTQGFTNNGLVHTNNRIENTGATGIFKAEAIVSAEMANNNQEVHLAFFKDDGSGFAIIPCSEQRIVASGGSSGRMFLIPIQCLVQLDTSDKLEVWIKNATSTSDATLENLNMILNELK